MPLHAEPAPLREPRCYRPLLLRPACCLPAHVTLLLLTPHLRRTVRKLSTQWSLRVSLERGEAQAYKAEKKGCKTEPRWRLQPLGTQPLLGTP